MFISLFPVQLYALIGKIKNFRQNGEETEKPLTLRSMAFRDFEGSLFWGKNFYYAIIFIAYYEER